MARAKKSVNFEEALEQLEDLVEAMEAGDLSLEDSLKSFEKGVKLTRECQQALNEAEQKVETLLKTESGVRLEAFGEEANEGDPDH